MKRIRSYFMKRYRRLSLRNKDFSIISNNCWGGFISECFALPYNSPFVGLFIFAPDYLELLENLQHYLNHQLVFISPDRSKYADELKKNDTYGKYPIGTLGEVEIHFLHYKSTVEAKEKWERRKSRINYSRLLVKFCDRDLATDDLIRRFDRLRYTNKICLTSRKYEYSSCVKLVGEDGEYLQREWESFLKQINPVSLLNKMKF